MLRVPLMQELFALPVVHIVLISVPTFLKFAVHIFLKKKKKNKQKQTHKETARGLEIF